MPWEADGIEERLDNTDEVNRDVGVEGTDDRYDVSLEDLRLERVLVPLVSVGDSESGQPEGELQGNEEARIVEGLGVGFSTPRVAEDNALSLASPERLPSTGPFLSSDGLTFSLFRDTEGLSVATVYLLLFVIAGGFATSNKGLTLDEGGERWERGGTGEVLGSGSSP